MRRRQFVHAIIEPPSDGDPHWLMSAPAISYFVQGDSKREVIKMFDEGLDDAIEFFTQGDPVPQHQPEMRVYEIRV